jgi:hypothetical protein
MNNLKLNLLTEQVYLTGQVNRIYENILKEDEHVDPKDDSIIKKVLNDFGIGAGFIFQFGTGIGAFMRPVTELLNGNGVSMSQEEVALLIITAFTIMLSNSSVELGRLIKVLKDRGLDIHLGSVTKFILNVKKLMGVIGEKIGRTVHTLADVLGFTFMLVPTMNVLKEIINDYGVSMDNLGQLFGGLVMAAGSYGIKGIIDKILNRKQPKESPKIYGNDKGVDSGDDLSLQ